MAQSMSSPALEAGSLGSQEEKNISEGGWLNMTVITLEWKGPLP